MRKIPVYNHPAAGWSALIDSSRVLMDYHAFLRGSISVLHSNQPNGGFDCPGCAWPDHKTHKTIDVCESGIKVLASETMSTQATAEFFANHSVSELQQWSGYQLDQAGRLSEPMRYDVSQDRYVPISWEEAFDCIAEVLNSLESPDEALFYTSGRVTNEPAFLYQLFVRLFGTNNLPDCSNMCHEPTSVMLTKQLGVGKATVTLEDFEQAELILMFGQNPATNHPRMLEVLADTHEEGCRIISINPMREQGLSRFKNPQRVGHMLTGGSEGMVDDVIQIQIGGDAALLTGLAKWLIDNDKINQDFIQTHTSGFDELKKWVQAQSWEDIEYGSGISQAEIISLAQVVAESKATICTWGMGITQHVQGDDNVGMITNLLLLMGMIGVTGTGASPVRGHSNVQGDRTMGIHERPAAALLDSLEQVFQRPMPREDGYDVVTGAQAMQQGKIKAFMAMGGNYSVAAPDTKAIQRALTNNQLNVLVATKLNETMLYPGTNPDQHNIILPCLSRTEKFVTANGAQFATIEDSMCQVVATQGHLKPISDKLKSEAQIVAGIASRVFATRSQQQTSPDAPVIDWEALAEDYDLIRDYIAQAIGGFEDFNQRIRESKRGFHLYHPARHHQWHTATGKAQFFVPQYPITYVANEMQQHTEQAQQRHQYSQAAEEQVSDQSEQTVWQFTSVRSHDQFNTTIFGMEDRYRQTKRRDVLFMHPDEIQRMGWQAGNKIVVSRQDSQGNTRQLGPLVLTEMDIASNAVAAYYPECNDLMDLDSFAPNSHIPAYKSVTVSLKRILEPAVQ
ncbi:FdhF/YdeP family oxidoreductase [Psychrobacter lutiphocae]|uniref:FdhF/YdeP family oxidoreductase n=1 Tax=Psychrobacter lutiphocae TaxID=540500 RepID=UPI000363106F|nr:FdhF/YdeP family oxidoreductase [Psychrobacter lutiphocae]